MELIHVPGTKLDLDKWDQTIAQSKAGLPYALSWYLDIVTQKHWNALLNKDYSQVMPLPGCKWLLRQPPFCQQLGIFGNEFSREVVDTFLASLAGKTMLTKLQFNESNLPWLKEHPNFSQKVNYTLSLRQPYDQIWQQYHPSLRRQVQKNRQKLHIENLTDTKLFLDFYLSCNRDKFRLSTKKKAILANLCREIIRRAAGKIYAVIDESGKYSAMNLLYIGKWRIIHLFPASSPEGRQKSAMAYLLDYLIQSNAENNRILDFEGSVIPGIARFYRNFGAIESPYPVLRKAWIRSTPWKYNF